MESETDFHSKWNQYNTALTLLNKKVSKSDNPSQDERILSMFEHTRLLFDDVKQHASQKPWNTEWMDKEGKKAEDALVALKKTLFPNQKPKQPKSQIPQNHQKPSNFAPNNMQEELARKKRITELEEQIEKYPKEDPYGKLKLIMQLEEEQKKLRKEYPEFYNFSSYMDRLRIFKTDFSEFCQKRDLATVKIFIEFFDDYPSLDYRNEQLLSSVRSGQLEIVQYLLKEGGADSNYKIIDGWNLAHHAAWHNQPEVLIYLWKNHNPLCLQITPKGPFNGYETILHLAVRNQAREVVDTILQIDPIKFINCREQSGYTPLHHAVYYNLVDLAKSLLPYSNLNIRNNKQERAYDMARNNAKDGWLFSASQEAKTIYQFFLTEIEQRFQQSYQQNTYHSRNYR